MCFPHVLDSERHRSAVPLDVSLSVVEARHVNCKHGPRHPIMYCVTGALYKISTNMPVSYSSDSPIVRVCDVKDRCMHDCAVT